GEPPGEPGPVAETGPGEQPDTPPRTPQYPIDPLGQEYDALLARLRSDGSEEIRAEARALGQRIAADVDRDPRVKTMHETLAAIEQDFALHARNAQDLAALAVPDCTPPFVALVPHGKQVVELCRPEQYGSTVFQERARSELDRRVQALRADVAAAVAPILSIQESLKERERGVFIAAAVSKKLGDLEEARNTLEREFAGVAALAKVYDAISADEINTLRSQCLLFAADERSVSQKRTDVQKAEAEIDWKLPYSDLVDRIQSIPLMLRLPQGSTDWLRQRLAELERNTLDRLAAQAEQSFRTACAQAGQEILGTPLAGFETRIDALMRGRSALEQAFPAQRELWRKILPEGVLEGWRRRIEEITELRTRIENLAARFSPAPSLAEWRRELARAVAADTERLEAALGELRSRLADPVPSDLADLEAALGEVKAMAQAWSGHTEALGKAMAALDTRHEIETALRAVASIRSAGVTDPALGVLDAALHRLQDGFKVLFQELGLEQARVAFEEAAAGLRKAEYSARYPQACRARLDVLQSLAEGMAAVPGGKAQRAGGGEPVEIDGFFIDRYEVSVREFKAFLDFLQKRPSYNEEMARLWDIEEARDASMNARERWSAYRSGHSYYDQTADHDLPAEYVNYYQARAFLGHHGKDLPTLEEWTLAAKGRYPHRRFTFTTNPSPRLDLAAPEDIYFGRCTGPTRVKAGGIVMGLTPSVHHLAGNVAEWTRMEEGAARGRLLGGSYLHSDERYYSGELREEKLPSEGAHGCGFRGVVRPKDLFRDLIAR
ncbi:MAG: SUMF1/EgtB/PvdO family nonheme iron enzyme, partial [Planctomycetes bacterium]|nr:SUMF1/EgtB/PvdO family nonheme iron enzyme [Planctomycetota bacterium]